MPETKRESYADFAAMDALLSFVPIIGAVIVTKHFWKGTTTAKLFIVWAWVYSIGLAASFYFYLSGN